MSPMVTPWLSKIWQIFNLRNFCPCVHKTQNQSLFGHNKRAAWAPFWIPLCEWFSMLPKPNRPYYETVGTWRTAFFRNQIDPISSRHFVFRSSEEESSSPDERVGVFVCGLQPARITWWASPNWPSSQTRVTSVNLLSYLMSPMKDCEEEEEFV